MNFCHVSDTNWNPRNPDRYGDIAEGYRQAGLERHLADGWRVAVPFIDVPGYRHDASLSTVVFGSETATEVPDAAINIAEESAALDEAEKKMEADWLAAEDARIAKLPSVVAIIAENAALKTKLAAAEAALAAVKATADKAAADVAKLEALKPK